MLDLSEYEYSGIAKKYLNKIKNCLVSCFCDQPYDKEDDEYKYERCALLVVDFSKEKPVIYNTTDANRLLYSTVLSFVFTIVVICSIAISLSCLFGWHFGNAFYLIGETAPVGCAPPSGMKSILRGDT